MMDFRELESLDSGYNLQTRISRDWRLGMNVQLPPLVTKSLYLTVVISRQDRKGIPHDQGCL